MTAHLWRCRPPWAVRLQSHVPPPTPCNSTSDSHQTSSNIMPMTYAESNYCPMPAAHVCSGGKRVVRFLSSLWEVSKMSFSVKFRSSTLLHIHFDYFAVPVNRSFPCELMSEKSTRATGWPTTQWIALLHYTGRCSPHWLLCFSSSNM